jgi:putative transposase
MSRGAGPGGSYRPVQRFFSTVIPWATLCWVFFRHHLYRADGVYLLAGDEVVVTKAGQHTHGLERFLSRLYGQPVPGLAFFTLSFVSIQERYAFPMCVEPVVRSAAEKAASKTKAAARQQKPSIAKRRPGRPKGSKNTTQADVSLTPELWHMRAMLDAFLKLVAGSIPLTYWVLDGHFGNHHALPIARQGNLHLISKRRCAAALYFPYRGPYAGRGPHRTYGHKVDDDNIPGQDLQETPVEGHIQTRWYQAQLLHKEFAQPLHVVIIAKTPLQTQARAHVILFSSDLELAYAPLVDDDGLRFQLECNFRDAKQYWGLEDFMNVTRMGVTNAAHLSLFMVNVAYQLRTDVRQRAPDYSVLDLKADCRGSKYVEETIQLLPEKPEPVLFAMILNQVAGIGRIHAVQPAFSFS